MKQLNDRGDMLFRLARLNRCSINRVIPTSHKEGCWCVSSPGLASALGGSRVEPLEAPGRAHRVWGTDWENWARL
jgi:hypothetical protein